MLVPLDVFLLVIYAAHSAAGPVPKFSNTSTEDMSFLVPTYTKSSGRSTLMHYQPLYLFTSIDSDTISAEAVTSRTAASPKSSKTSTERYALSASKSHPQGIAAASISFSFSYSPPHRNITDATSSTTSLRSRSRTFPESTTTVTRFTTVGPGPSETGSNSNAANQESTSKRTEPPGKTSSKNVTSLTSQLASSSTEASQLVYGSIILTYTASSQTDSPSLIVSQMPCSALTSSENTASSSSISSQTTGSGSQSSFFYPIPEITSSSQTTLETLKTTESSTFVSALTTAFSPSTIARASSSGVHKSSDSRGQQAGLPDIVTAASPTSSTTLASSMNNQGGGITIIPVDPNAMTVTVTTTEIDAGMTTTVAETTVTVSG